MPIKIYLDNEIHRFSKLPADFKALVNMITSTFQDRLPKSWSIHYIDPEGDKISLCHDHDYTDILEVESQQPSETLKLYIVPCEGLGISQIVSADHTQNKNVPADIEEKKISDQVIAPPRNDQDREEIKLDEDKRLQAQESLNASVKEKIKKNSQNKREKAAKADKMANLGQSQDEINARGLPQPLDEDPNVKKVMQKAIRIIEKISKGNVPDEKLGQMMEKLDKVQSSLTPEQKEELQKMMDKAQEKGNTNDCSVQEKMKESRSSKKNFEPSKAFRALEKIEREILKGDLVKVKKSHERLLEKLPGEAKQVLEPLSQALREEKDQEGLKKAIGEVRDGLIVHFNLQDKEMIQEGSDKRREKKGGLHEHRKHHHKNKEERVEGDEKKERQKKNPRSNKEKGDKVNPEFEG